MKGLILIFTILSLTLHAYAGKTFKDSDLKNYTRTGDVESKDAARSYDDRENVNDNKYDIDQWCGMWFQYRDDIEAAKEEVDYAKSEYYRPNSIVYSDQARNVLRRAIRILEDAEERFKKLEDKAWRLGVPKLSYECDEYDE